MAVFTDANITDMTTDVIVVPVPARIKNKNKEKLPEVAKEVFEKYKLSYERYKEFSRDKDDFSNGQIVVCRDASFEGINIEDPSTPVEEILNRIENHSRLILILPTSKTDQDEVDGSVYMSCFRAFRLLLENPEVKENVKSISIPEFDTLRSVIDKVEEIFSDIELEVFVCLRK